MKVAYTIHGFAEAFRGKLTTDSFRPALESFGWQVREWDYGFSLIPDLFVNRRESKKLSADMQTLPRDTTVGLLAFSNGCRIAQLVLEELSRMKNPVLVDRCSLINPALDRDARFAAGVRKILVYHSKHDVATGFARFIPWSPWGDMGAHGYEGVDGRVVNRNLETDFTRAAYGHHGVFFHKGFWVPVIAGEFNKA